VGYHYVMWTLDANFLHSCWMLHVLLKHQTVVYDVPTDKNHVLVGILYSGFIFQRAQGQNLTWKPTSKRYSVVSLISSIK